MNWIIASNQIDAHPGSAVRVGIFIPHTLPEGHPPVHLSEKPSVGRFKHRPGCKGSMEVKAIEFSNKLRGALGLPLIPLNEPMRHKIQFENGQMQALHPHRFWHHGQPHPRHHHQLYNDSPFVSRLANSLNNLGKWEGRAVAFVIGKSFNVSLIVTIF